MIIDFWINFTKKFFVELMSISRKNLYYLLFLKVTKGKDQSQSFYSLPEFNEWKNETDNWHTWKVKYYKGLGTSTSKEAKEYFSDMLRHKIKFRYKNYLD